MKRLRPDPSTVPTNAMPAIFVGLAVILVGLVGFTTWAALADIASAIVSPGTVKVLSNRKQVQSPEGGIVREIAVRDGARVVAGDVLIRLDDTNARASLGIVEGNHDLVEATVARLRAERDRAAEITFPDELVGRAEGAGSADILAGQRKLFDARRDERAGQIEIRRERIGQLDEEIAGLEAQSSARAEQIEVIASQEADLQALLEKELVPRSQVLQLQREQLRLRGEKAEVDAAIARSRRLISEAELDILQFGRAFDREVNDELGVKETEMFALAERLSATRHSLDQTVIRATESGVVVGLAVHTVGGVVQPGATLLEIVPIEDNLVIEARIRPVDMDNIAVGQPVDVVFPGLSQADMPRLAGTIDYVSADVLTDPVNGARYFSAEVGLDKGGLADLREVKLLPGMPAEIFVKTGERSPLAYLTQPLRDSLARAWRDP